MTKEQKDYVVSQLDKMAEELESVDDVAERAKLRGKYIELFIDLCTIANTVISAPVEEDLIDEEPIQEDEAIEEPESVTAETEAVVEEPKEEPEEEEGFDDAEVLRSVINEDGEEVDITDAFNALRKEGMDEDFSDSIGLFLTECEGLDAYMNKFSYMEHGIPRACAAQLAAILTEQQLQAYIIDFSGLDLGAIENSTDFIDDANAEELFDFIRKDMEERQE